MFSTGGLLTVETLSVSYLFLILPCGLGKNGQSANLWWKIIAMEIYVFVKPFSAPII
jgi:hypothetical protein